MKYCPKCAGELESRTVDGEARRACSRDGCDYVHWNNPVPVVAAIVETDGGVVLVQSKGWPETWFGLVTGFLEKGETPEQGVLREVKEELGLDGSLEGFVGLYSFFQMNQLIIAYHVRANGEVVLGDELADYKRVPTEKLRPWPTGTGDAVRDWLGRRED